MMLNLLFRQEKKQRGSKTIIYRNGTILLKSKTSKYGMNIPSGLYRWKKLPKKKSDDKLKVVVDFWHKKNKFESVLCIIYHNNYSCYLRPVNNKNQEQNILQLMKKNAILKCVIPNKVSKDEQIPSTDYLKQALFLAEQVVLPNIDTLQLVTFGRMQNTKYEIYSDNEMNLYLKCRGKISRKGVLILSSEISRYIQNWFEKEILCLCSINAKPPIVLTLTTRKRNSTKKIYKELNLPYYGDPKEGIVYFTSNGLELTKQARKDLQLKSQLSNNGYNFLNLKSTLRHGKHYNREFEQRVRDLIGRAFRDYEDTILLSEVELTLTDDDFPLTGWDKHRFDSFIYHQDDFHDYVALIELKTSIEPSNKCGIIESAIAKLYQFRKRINKKTIVPILIINEDIYYQGEIATKAYGDLCNVILIGRKELVALIENPSHLHKRIQNYLDTQGFKQSPPPIKMRAINSVSEGSAFEEKIKDKLLIEGYKVQSNVLYRVQSKHMEIDHITTKQDEKILVSCKDHKTITSEWKILLKLSDILNIIVLRKALLGFSQARLYVKVHPKIKDKITQILNLKEISEVDVFIE